MPKPTIRKCASEHEFLEVASKEILSTIAEILSKKETCRIGLSGGTTPKAVYRRLSELHIPWEKVTLIIIDERLVPASDKRSNYGMIRDELIGNITIPHENVIFFDTSLGYDSAVLAHEQKLLALKRADEGREPLFDLLILGAGPDGHIAGIFPDSLATFTKGFLTAKTSTDTFDVHDRLTCTMEALISTAKAILMLKGHEKSHILHQLEHADTSTPIGILTEKVPTTVIFH